MSMLHTNMICELVEMKDCNNDTVFNKESQHNIICFLAAISNLQFV